MGKVYEIKPQGLKCFSHNTFLPTGYKWEHFTDGTGYIVGPDNNHYFIYRIMDTRIPGQLSDCVMYRHTEQEEWQVFHGTFLMYRKCVNSIFLEFMISNIGENAEKNVLGK